MKSIERLLMLLLVGLLTACGAKEKGTDLPLYQSLDDLKGKKVAVMTGSFHEGIIEKRFPEVEAMRIDYAADLAQALLAKQCEAAIFDDYVFRYHSQTIKGLTAMEEPLSVSQMGYCFGKGKNVELRESFNEFLKKIKADGTYQEIYDKWVFHANEAEMPDIQLPEDKNPIRVATSSTSPPIDFIKNGKLVGLDIELVTRFAQHIGRGIVWSDMTFASMIPALVSGTQDMIAGSVVITSARAESVDFSDPYFDCGAIVAIRGENAPGYVAEETTSDESFVESVQKSFHRNIIEEDRYLMILDGLKLTALISLFAGLFGTLLGALVCWMRMCKYAVLRQLAGIYVSLMRGTPVLVLLMLMFYVVFAGTSIDAVMVSIITFGMNFGAYVSEMFRSSIESVDRGQTEAGIALGFTPVKTFCYIVMPQAFKQVLPVFKGEWISMVKMTSIVGYIAVQDLTKVGDIIRSRTFDAFFPLIMVAVLYFVLSWIFATALDFIGKRTQHS